MTQLFGILGKLFDNNDEPLDYVLEVGSLFSNQLDKFALTGKLAFDIYSGREPNADKIEFLTTNNNIRSAIHSILAYEYRITSVVHNNEFYEVNLAKKKSQVMVHAFSCLPNVINDAQKRMIRYGNIAFDVSVASSEDILLVDMLYNDNFSHSDLAEKVGKKNLLDKYDKFPEELRHIMNERFRVR